MSQMNGQDNFTNEQLRLALYDVQDILERALCPFVLLDETAKSLMESEVLKGDGIYIGVEKRYITPEVVSTLKMYLKDTELTDKGFDYKWNDVPVHVKFIYNKYQFFTNLDFRFYMANQYYLPNPWKEYWKSRSLIQ